MTRFTAPRPEDTEAIARAMAQQAAPGDIFCLSGPLGAGKSVFARGFIRALCGEQTDVPSPTFTLVQTYDGRSGPVAHFDLYRLEDPEEVLALDWDEAMAGSICLIEWPEKATAFLPRRRTDITITQEEGGEARSLAFTRHE